MLLFAANHSACAANMLIARLCHVLCALGIDWQVVSCVMYYWCSLAGCVMCHVLLVFFGRLCAVSHRMNTPTVGDAS